MNFAMPARKWLIAGLATATLQSLAIGWMVWDRIQLLRHGRELVLPVVPVDPRSLFRGDYVILSYDAQRVPVSMIPAELDAVRPSTFYVTLTKSGDTWKPTTMTRQAAAPSADQISLKGRSQFGYWPVRIKQAAEATTSSTPRVEPMMQVRYGIESYFVPEGKGLRLEEMARSKKLAAVIAVDAKGNAAIKGLMIDGKLEYEEPLL